jgi:SnoaL-like protein
MTLKAFRSWLEAYGRAWESRDADAAANLYTNNATYQVTPFLEPMRGRARIHDYWVHVAATEKQIRFEFEILAVRKDFGLAHWRASFVRLPSRKIELDGIFLISLDASGRCLDLREWWQKRETEQTVATV